MIFNDEAGFRTGLQQSLYGQKRSIPSKDSMLIDGKQYSKTPHITTIFWCQSGKGSQTSAIQEDILPSMCR